MPSAATIRSASANCFFARDLGAEHEPDAEVAGSLLQDQEQRAPGAAAEAVAADAVDRAPEVDRDVVPVGEFLGDAPVAREIVLLEIVQRGVGEHDAEAEGVVGLVALMDGDVVARIGLLHQDREVEPGRPATDHRDLHERAPDPVQVGQRCLKLKAFAGQGQRRGTPLPEGEGQG